MEKDCPFCKIVGGETPADLLCQDENLVVFRDIHPGAPVHLLIVPKKHIRSINDLIEQDQDILWEMILKARELAQIQSIAGSGYKLLFNVERGGGQHIFHLHLHVLGGW
jgi:histidine triad (HIT) family protein